jgi:hypothetical protein
MNPKVKRQSMLLPSSSAESATSIECHEERAYPGRNELASLEHIAFTDARISDGYTRVLVNALKKRQSAVTLTLVKCSISCKALGLIVSSLPDMHHLTRLHIAHPQCKPSWLLAMEQGLPGNTSLTWLRLAVAKTTVKHTKAVARALRLSRSLERVDIELDYRTQILIVLKNLLGVLPSVNGPDTPHRFERRLAVPRLCELALQANKPQYGNGFVYDPDRFGDEACLLLTRLIEERILLERVKLVPGLVITEPEILVNLGRAADRQMVELDIDRKPYKAPPLIMSELRRRQKLFASTAALRAAAAALNFNATPDGVPLPTDVMTVIASHLPVQGSPRPSWLLRGLLSVNRAARKAADVSRSRTHANRLCRQLRDEPNDSKKGISLQKKQATADALADMWRLCFAGIPLRTEDAERIELAATNSNVWELCRALVTEKAMKLSRQHRETVQLLEEEGSPRAAYARRISAEVKRNGTRLPFTGMNELL